MVAKIGFLGYYTKGVLIYMNIFYVLYHNFTSQSSIHVFNLANQFQEYGWNCTVCIPDDKQSVFNLGQPMFQVVTYDEALTQNSQHRSTDEPTLVHAWTPREIVRKFTEKLRVKLQCDYIVHLEDNEEFILSENIGMPVGKIRSLPPGKLNELIPDWLAHPIYYKIFLGNSKGVSALIENLLEFKPSHVPGTVFWPGFDDDLFKAVPINYELRHKYGIDDGHIVIVYPGNVHAANRADVASLYLAVGIANRNGLPVKLIRTGTDHVQLLGADLEAFIRSEIVDLGYLNRRDLAAVMATANVFVQPGRSDDFNDYRFPSKLPEFFAIGRPVILPATNVGRHLEDNVECILLRHGNAIEIVQKLMWLAENHTSGMTIGKKGRIFAEKKLTWDRAAQILKKFYSEVWQDSKKFNVSLNGKEDRKNSELFEKTAIEDIAVTYSNYTNPILGYATVRDYCDSMEHLKPLATINSDLKDVQRPWVLKSILGTILPGGRLLEIGAGHPYVAGVLARLGYDVTVIDPYDGSANGPTQYETFKEMYRNLKMIRGSFPEDLMETASNEFDCIYSISVLEHVPIQDIRNLIKMISLFTRQGGYTVHAIDHVLDGNGAMSHQDQLVELIDELGIGEEKLNSLLKHISVDTETYFLSAESHNLWRGALPYYQFPMRKVVSIQICKKMNKQVTRV